MTQPQIQMIPVEDIADNRKWNVRKDNDKAQQEELNASVKEKGILQAITVRPSKNGERYEIIAGSRRLEAARAAGLTHIAATVREADDQEAREMNIVENLQREDLHPMEAAQGLSELLRHAASGKQSAAAGSEDLAKKLGKPVRWVRRALKLLDLRPEWQKIFEQRKIGVEVAELVSRHTADDQWKIWKEYDNGSNVGSVRDLKEWIEENLMLDLRRAPFDTEDPKLLEKFGKVYKGWGACTGCQFRSGNKSDLFGDVKGDICARGACYHEKVGAMTDIKMEVAAKAGRKLIPIATESHRKPAGVPFAQTYSSDVKLVTKGSCSHAEEAIVVHAWSGESNPHERLGATTFICREKTCRTHFGGGRRGSTGKMTEGEKKKRASIILANKVDRAARTKVFASLLEKAAQGSNSARLQFLVGEIYDRFARHDDATAIFAVKGWPKGGGRFSKPRIEPHLKTIKDPADLFALLVMIPIAEEYNPEYSNGRTTRLARFCKAFGVDMKAIYRKEEKAILAAKAAKKKGGK